MAVKYLTIVFVSLALSFTEASVQTINGRIKITIGGSSGCNVNANYMQEVVPVYEEFKDFLDIEFVPWGRTRFENNTMICQFGPNDCWANRVHRCALFLLKGNQDAMVKYMGCEFTVPRAAFDLGSYACVEEVGLNLIDLDYCVTTTGFALEPAAQKAAALPMEIINFIPYTVFNDVVDRNLAIEALRRLRTVVCNALANDPTTGVTNC